MNTNQHTLTPPTTSRDRGTSCRRRPQTSWRGGPLGVVILGWIAGRTAGLVAAAGIGVRDHRVITPSLTCGFVACTGFVIRGFGGWPACVSIR